VAVKIYQYPKCGTCRKALKWLDARGVDYQSIDIVEKPPAKAALAQLMKRSGLPARKWFNTSGQSYRQGGFKEKLETMTDAQAADALASDGKLIKRPVVVGDDFVLVGFDEAEYGKRFR
jgi:arsenate reductase (glutaredoxin)